MKKCKNILYVILLLNSFICLAQPTSYQWRREITGVASKGYYSLKASPELLSQSNSNFTDFRIYAIKGADTIEAPFFWNWQQERVAEEKYLFSIINQSYKKKCCSFFTVKLSKSEEINKLIVQVKSEKDYFKSVKVESSNDNSTWATVAENLHIARYTFYNKEYLFNELRFPAVQAEFLRVTIDDSDSEPVYPDSSAIIITKSIPGEYTLLNSSVVRSEIPKLNNSVFDLNFNDQTYIKKISIDKAEGKTNYYRYINIYRLLTNGNGAEYWEQIANSVVTSSDPFEYFFTNSEAGIQTSKLRVEIENKNDNPLPSLNVKAYGLNAQLVCELAEKNLYYLYYGKKNDQAATYDIEHFRDKVLKSLAYEINLGVQQKNPLLTDTTKAPLVKTKWWLWGILILLGGLLTLFAFSMLKKIKNN